MSAHRSESYKSLTSLVDINADSQVPPSSPTVNGKRTRAVTPKMWPVKAQSSIELPVRRPEANGEISHAQPPTPKPTIRRDSGSERPPNLSPKSPRDKSSQIRKRRPYELGKGDIARLVEIAEDAEFSNIDSAEFSNVSFMSTSKLRALCHSILCLTHSSLSRTHHINS